MIPGVSFPERCPEYTRSVSVTSVDTAITITARYDSSNQEDEILDVKVLEVGESYTFGEKSEDMGTWQKVRQILSVRYEEYG